MKASELRGKAVVTIEGAEKLGIVRDVLIDTEARRIVALQLKTEIASEAELVPVERVHSTGKDAITLERAAVPREGHPSGGREEGTISLTELLDTKALSYEGNHLGTVADVHFDPATFQITEYELRAGLLAGITGGRKKLQATPDIHLGKGIMTVPENAYAESSEAEEAAQTEPKERVRRPR